MNISRLFLTAAAALAFSGCASFTSGDIKVDKATAKAMFEDRSVTPFANIQLTWKNYPYRESTDTIGEGTISTVPGQFKIPTVKPVPVEPEDQAKLLKQARDIFSDAGLYNKLTGKGTLRLELESVNRWTYSELFHTFFVETGLIFIIPSSMRVNFLLTAHFPAATGTAKVETIGTNKTIFHLLLAPLYPFFSPSSGEKGLLRQMLWRSATDVYDAIKHAEAVKAAGQTAPEPAPAAAQPAAIPAAPAPAAAQPAPAVPQPAAAPGPARTPSAPNSADETPDD